MHSDPKARAAAFDRFAGGGADGAVEELAEFVERWGSDGDFERPVLTTWAGARQARSALWLAAMSRSRACCQALIQAKADLSPLGGDPALAPWRYAARNGWAGEAAALLDAQAASSAPPLEGWALLWESVSEGCRAQEEGAATLAVDWLKSALSPKAASGAAQALSLLSRLAEIASPAPKRQEGSDWEPLLDRAAALWGAPGLEQAGAALAGHPRAKGLALSRCSVSAASAEREMASLLKAWDAPGDETMAMMSSVLGAALKGANIAMSAEDAWGRSRRKAEAFAQAARGLMERGASLPPGALDQALGKEAWTRAYALALAGAKPAGLGAPPLWILARGRAAGSQGGSIMAMAASAAGTGGAKPWVDAMALDLAQALKAAGARAGERGPDGRDAVEALCAPDPALATLRSALDAIGASGSPGAASGRPVGGSREDLEARGLSPLLDFLVSCKEAEEIGEAAGGAGAGKAGARRL